MEHLFLVLGVIFFIAVTMAIVGKGGGNFYVVTLILAGVSMTQAAATSQLLMTVTSLAALVIFSKKKKVDWKLAFIIGIPMTVTAFLGGYYASGIADILLRIIFAGLLGIVSILMLVPMKIHKIKKRVKFGVLNRTFKSDNYTINLWVVIPIVSAVGFFSGAVGISGGSFLIPLMVMLCGTPMIIAVGTSFVIVSTTASMGFLGHFMSGDFNPEYIGYYLFMALVGGIIGGLLAQKVKPTKLKIIFVLTNLVAVTLIVLNIISDLFS